MHNVQAPKIAVYSLCFLLLAFPQEGNAQIEKSISWGYDSQGRLSYETISGGGTTQYLNYSDHGIAKNVKYKSEVIVRDMSFNLDGTASTIGYSSNAQTQASYSYSAFSSPLDSQLDINNVRTFEEKTMRYDSRGNLKSLVKYYDGSNINYAYDYDAMGKLKKFSINNSSVNYNYDDKGNLTGKNGLSAINGKLQVSALPTQSYNIKNQNTHWQYDNDGRVIEDHEFSYQYNHAGRLTLISSKSTGQWVSHFLYDASGNRVRKMTPENVTYYYRNAKGDIVSEEKFDLESGELIEKQRHIAHNGMNVASVNSNSENEPVVNYQYSGRLGSQSVRWNAQQVLTQDYAPYGEQMDSDNIHSGSYGFTGHEDDTETESTYMKARHYKTNYGRMNRPDPARDFDIHNPSSFNLYAYVGNNPVNAWDPTGLASEEPHIFIAHGTMVESPDGSSKPHTLGEVTLAVPVHMAAKDGEAIFVSDVEQALGGSQTILGQETLSGKVANLQFHGLDQETASKLKSEASKSNTQVEVLTGESNTRGLGAVAARAKMAGANSCVVIACRGDIDGQIKTRSNGTAKSLIGFLVSSSLSGYAQGKVTPNPLEVARSEGVLVPEANGMDQMGGYDAASLGWEARAITDPILDRTLGRVMGWLGIEKKN